MSVSVALVILCHVKGVSERGAILNSTQQNVDRTCMECPAVCQQIFGRSGLTQYQAQNCEMLWLYPGRIPG